jgi:hypothetical protein
MLKTEQLGLGTVNDAMPLKIEPLHRSRLTIHDACELRAHLIARRALGDFRWKFFESNGMALDIRRDHPRLSKGFP